MTQSKWGQRLQARELSPEVSAPEAWRRKKRTSYAAYHDDPLGFATVILRGQQWDGMEQILNGVRDHDRVAIRAGRKVSKSWSLAALAYWWLLCRGGRVFMTPSSGAQIKSILWHEITSMNEKARLGLTVPLDPFTGVRKGLASIVGRSTDTRENMQGYSGADVLYLVDESSGVASEIIEAIEGNCAGGGKIVLAGNPTKTSGRYFDALYKPNSRWHQIHLNSELTPNVLEGRMVIPGLATRAWIEQMQEEWGRDSPLYQVHVLGNAPTQSENAVIGIGLVQEAKERLADAPRDGPLRLGVDVARFGDDVSVIQAVRGFWAAQPYGLQSMDGVQLATAVINYAEQHRNPTEQVRVKVDVIGVGASVVDQLKHNGPAWMTVEAVTVSEKAINPHYARLRDELWFSLRDWLRQGGTIPDHPTLEAELIAPIYGFDAAGRMKVESKDDIKKRLGRSPDYADSLCLAVFEPDTAPKAHFRMFSV